MTEDVANNVAQAKVQDLTEQWKKGELEVDKYYYVKCADGSVEIQLYVGGFLMRTDNRVVEVLSPVPICTEPFDIIANCKYCRKEFRGEKK